MSEFSGPSKWDSGLYWHYTVWHPMFFGVQGEVTYSFLLLLYFPSFTLLKMIVTLIGVLLLARMLGYSIGGLIRRWNRWRLGEGRPIYSVRRNYRRLQRGI